MAVPDVCPNCGAAVPQGAKACPECGSDEETGWSEQAKTDSLDLPDESFDYEEFTKREFGNSSPKPRGVRWFWWLIAILLAASLVLTFVL
jgi:zinc-ribbon domain